jgi:DNA-binding GntR family transcriptional regulator
MFEHRSDLEESFSSSKKLYSKAIAVQSAVEIISGTLALDAKLGEQTLTERFGV